MTDETNEYLSRIAKALKLIEGLESLDSEQLFLLDRILRGESNEKNDN